MMWPFSYSFCATCIVRRAAKPSLRFASCCSVLVVNGSGGLRVYGFSSSFVTRNWPRISRSASSRACCSFEQQRAAGP